VGERKKRSRKRWLMLICGALVLVPAGTSQAEPAAYTVHYGPLEDDYAVVHPAPGRVPLLLLHEAGYSTEQTEAIAFGIQREAAFTVINLEWDESPLSGGIWEYDVGQVEEAVEYVRLNAVALGVDANRLEMLGASRGANLAMLAGLELNAAAPGTVKAVAALSGDADPISQMERARRGELTFGVPLKLSRVYGCRPILKSCPTAYIRRWSPIEKASSSAPAMFLAASEAETRTASLTDEYALAARLQEANVAAEVFAPLNGHGFAYWKAARPPTLAFLLAAQQGV
jgi:hypothetical protein